MFVLKSNSMIQVEIGADVDLALEVDPREAALREVEEAIGLVNAQAQPVELSPPERLHPTAAAPDGGARQPRFAVARA